MIALPSRWCWLTLVTAVTSAFLSRNAPPGDYITVAAAMALFRYPSTEAIQIQKANSPRVNFQSNPEFVVLITVLGRGKTVLDVRPLLQLLVLAAITFVSNMSCILRASRV